MEKLYVHNFYDKNSKRFDHTRAYTWKGITDFVKSFKSSSKLLDAGCGNCKNMLIRNDCNIMGFDFCQKFVKIGKKKGCNVFQANIKNIPLSDNTFDGVYSVAVIHHIDSIMGRKKAVNELIRVTKPGGKIFIQVWADTVPKNKKFIQIKDNDYFVTWYVDKDNIEKRYYHLFSKDEIINLLDNSVIINKIDYEVNNWVLYLTKK